jgi:aminoglycoside phosphotransferase (APT) family kinase protein
MIAAVEAVLVEACARVGLDSNHAELIRAGENTLFRLPGSVVARVTRKRQLAAAAKEVRVSRWLVGLGVPVVVALSDVDQPVEVNGRAVTFWHELPAHRRGSLTELADLLRQLHAVPAPDFELPLLAPFVRLPERVEEAGSLAADDRGWLLRHLTDLQRRYAGLPPGRPWCTVHGDAWRGNVAVTADGPLLLDLERFAYGPPEWDLASVAVNYTTFGNVSADEWMAFCERYGQDVTTWAGFEVLRDIRELRKVTFAAQMAGQRPDLADQARYRLACVRGGCGPRPWGWTGVP